MRSRTARRLCAQGQLRLDPGRARRRPRPEPDGDLDDLTLAVYDPSAGSTHQLGLAIGEGAISSSAFPELALDDDPLAFFVSEADQAETDLNGDGDTADVVLHTASLKFSAPTIGSYSAGARGWRQVAPVIDVLGNAAANRP